MKMQPQSFPQFCRHLQFSNSQIKGKHDCWPVGIAKKHTHETQLKVRKAFALIEKRTLRVLIPSKSLKLTTGYIITKYAIKRAA